MKQQLNEKRRAFRLLVLCSLLLALLANLGIFSVAKAGIYDADVDVTYKEYWVPHSQFTGGFVRAQENGEEISLAQPGCPNTQAANSWYLEAWPRRDVNGAECNKVLSFVIPDDFEDALKIEIYLDLWRNQTSRAVNFSLNRGVAGIPANSYRPTVGLNWSRTPWVAEINQAHLQQGTNTITFWTSGGGHHVHDIAFRIYFDEDHPLRNPQGNPIAAPTGALVSIEADNGVKSPGAGGTLTVNSDQLKLTATAAGNVKFVEFHAYYDGYDEDNDGVFRDWHNRGRNNWHPGGTDAKPGGGTIDHVGTSLNDGDNSYSAIWNLRHIPNQSDVRFKVRIVSDDNVVRDAASGASASFDLLRNRSVLAFYNPAFVDRVLHHNSDPNEPAPGYSDTYTATVDLQVSPNDYDKGYLIGAYWQNPWVQINGNAQFKGSAGFDLWALGIQERSIGEFRQGQNALLYSYAGGFGQFIEKPGPLLVLRQTSPSSDNQAPFLISASPSPGATDVALNSAITLRIGDDGYGVDISSLRLRVKGQIVTPTITGFSSGYTLTYQPSPFFNYGEAVQVSIEAQDLAGNELNPNPKTYTFTTEFFDVDAEIESDDFNACAFDAQRWSWIDPQIGTAGESNVRMSGQTLEISVPAGLDPQDSHEIWTSGAQAPRLMQEINNGNFSVDVKFESGFSQKYQIQGVLIEQDENNLIRIDLSYDGAKVKLFAAKIVNGSASTLKSINLPAGVNAGPFYLRIVRTSPSWKVQYSLDGQQWTPNNFTFQHILAVQKIGIYAGNAPGSGLAPAHQAVVDYFFDSAEPIAPEDQTALRLDDLSLHVTPADAGTVTGGPVNAVTEDPTCGSPLRLLAAPNPGWKFERWEGSLLGTATLNPLESTFTVGEVITGVFAAAQFPLIIEVVNQGEGEGGTATADPQQTLYDAGQPVTLAASPNPGWRFAGWSGDASGSEPQIVLTMDGPRTVIATFVQEHYTLMALTAGSGQGSVALDPQKPFYVYGDAVTLTATPQNGAVFAGWSGDLPQGADPLAPVLQVTMQGNRTLTATFAQHYTLLTSVNGEGNVTVEPLQEEYQLGETVTLSATPAAGWTFVAWGGDLAGTDNPKTTVIDDSSAGADRLLMAVAYFAQRSYTVETAVQGEGVVVHEPSQTTFFYGDQVTFSAVPAEGWKFVGWQGTTNSIDNPLSLEVTDNVSLTAAFVPRDVGRYTVFLPTIRAD